MSENFTAFVKFVIIGNLAISMLPITKMLLKACVNGVLILPKINFSTLELPILVELEFDGFHIDY
ncbi:hypothetical protein [Thiomicrorhabdus sp.]|uniref:hypothetical protein n=1 Tax=Thiomicrorhabdus sp. TaxID=2039724 RepID=UPI0029C67CFA|nr:hypothetical protein [Thiomicrorhabdus sp.]